MMAQNYLTNPRMIERCVTKRKYDNRHAAYVAAKMTSKNGRPYKCKGLKGEKAHWHVTGGQKW